MDRLLSIENAVYEHPWSRAQFSSSLADTNTQSQALLLEDRIIGYVLFLPVAENADILNICIDCKYQHQGFGQQLFARLLSKLQSLAVESLFLEVRASNAQALRFYHHLGFETINTRKKYYSNLEDAKIMRLSIK